MEDELFGHEKGSCTGTHARKPGKFELAGGGTLFLDEIGELPLELQAKLLRVLQEDEFQRLGGVTTLKTNVRIVAARCEVHTNRDGDDFTPGNDVHVELGAWALRSVFLCLRPWTCSISRA